MIKSLELELTLSSVCKAHVHLVQPTRHFMSRINSQLEYEHTNEMIMMYDIEKVEFTGGTYIDRDSNDTVFLRQFYDFNASAIKSDEYMVGYPMEENKAKSRYTTLIVIKKIMEEGSNRVGHYLNMASCRQPRYS